VKQFLVISAGTDAASATPVLATSDRSAIEAAIDALAERAGVHEPTETVTRA